MTVSRCSGSSRPGHRFLDLIDQFVNDAVEFDLNAFAFRRVHGHALDFDVEADDDRVRRARQQDVGFGNRSDAGMNNFEIDFLALDLTERAGRALRASLARRISERCARCFLPSAASSKLSSVARCGTLNLSGALRSRRRSSLKVLRGALRFHDEKFIARLRQSR